MKGVFCHSTSCLHWTTGKNFLGRRVYFRVQSGVQSNIAWLHWLRHLERPGDGRGMAVTCKWGERDRVYILLSMYQLIKSPFNHRAPLLQFNPIQSHPQTSYLQTTWLGHASTQFTDSVLINIRHCCLNVCMPNSIQIVTLVSQKAYT